MEVSPLWTVVSDGRSLFDVMAAVERQPDCRIGASARDILKRSSIKNTAGTVHGLVAIQGEEIGLSYRRTTENILREAHRRGFASPAPEAALLLRETFPQDVLGYSRIVVFHKPLRDRDHHPSLLALCQTPEGEAKRNLLIALEAYPKTMWRPTDAFVFLAPRNPVSIFERPDVYQCRRSQRQPDYPRLASPQAPM